MTKSVEAYFADWEADAFGYGYGTGEPFILPKLRKFLMLCPDGEGYEHTVLEKELGPEVAWLLINRLCQLDVLEYGTSPRFAWLTGKGKRLKAFMRRKTDDGLVALVCESYDPSERCYPDACNCGPNGYEEGRVCANPFWGVEPPIRFGALSHNGTH